MIWFERDFAFNGQNIVFPPSCCLHGQTSFADFGNDIKICQVTQCVHCKQQCFSWIVSKQNTDPYHLPNILYRIWGCWISNLGEIWLLAFLVKGFWDCKKPMQTVPHFSPSDSSPSCPVSSKPRLELQYSVQKKWVTPSPSLLHALQICVC